MFENYTASFEIDTQRIELSLWDTSGNYALHHLILAASCWLSLSVVVKCPDMSMHTGHTQTLCDPCGHAPSLVRGDEIEPYLSLISADAEEIP